MTDAVVTSTTIVRDALAAHPKVRWVLAAYHIGHCAECSKSSSETLAEVATGYGLPLDRLLRDINAVVSG